jgi:hypothetical protein
LNDYVEGEVIVEDFDNLFAFRRLAEFCIVGMKNIDEFQYRRLESVFRGVRRHSVCG